MSNTYEIPVPINDLDFNTVILNPEDWYVKQPLHGGYQNSVRQVHPDILTVRSATAIRFKIQDSIFTGSQGYPS